MKLQPNTWTCGPTALYNAIAQGPGRGGRIGFKRVLATVKATPGAGCPVRWMRAGARRLGYDLIDMNTMHAPGARSLIVGELAQGHRLLLLCDRDYDGPLAHWLSIHKASARHVWIADSSGPGPVEVRMTWKAFLARACTVLGPAEWTYALYVLVPR